jgi:quinohemoprotein amine dehydrogenase
MEGRWFWGGYDEFGFNVTAHRDSHDVAILGTNVYSLHAGDKGVPFTLFGERFPPALTAADVGLGAGIHVSKIVSQKPTEISLLVDVDPVVVSGFRSVSVKSTIVPQAFSVYDKIDYIKVANDGSVARLGGGAHEKGYVQFEAIAFNRGIDGLPNTADDVSLGPVTAKWSMEEFISHYGDDDKEFIGSLDINGLFTPAMEGPNPQRRFSTNNNGDVWVVGTYQDKTAKAYLVVAVPLYMKWDQPEVGQ